MARKQCFSNYSFVMFLYAHIHIDLYIYIYLHNLYLYLSMDTCRYSCPGTLVNELTRLKENVLIKSALRVWISPTENNKCHTAASATSAPLQRSLIPWEAAINSLHLIQKCSAKILTQSCLIFSPSVINIFDNPLLEHAFHLNTLLIPWIHLSSYSQVIAGLPLKFHWHWEVENILPRWETLFVMM